MGPRIRRYGTAVLLFSLLHGCECEQLAIRSIPGTVEGRLCDPVSGQAAPGHVLKVSSDEGEWEADSGDDGRVSLQNVAPGDVTVRIVHRWPAPVGERVDYEQKTRLEEAGLFEVFDAACIDLPLAPGKGGIQGQVCNRHTGLLLGGADVTVLSNAGEEHRATTDLGGFFAFSAVSAGDHMLSVRGEGFQRTWPVHVESGEVTRLNLGDNCRPFDPSGTGSVGGRLCATNGEGPWALARVRLPLSDGTVLEDVTDAEGRFVIEGVPPGAYDLQVSGDGEQVTLHAVVVEGQTTNLEDAGDCPAPGPETGDVRGQLCDPEAGGWLVGAVAQTQQAGRTMLDHTDERGRFHLAGLATGDVVIDVTKGNYQRSFEVPIVAGTTVTVADGVCAPPTGECRTEELNVQDVSPLQVMLVVDKSGSMDELGLDGYRWESAKSSLKTVTQQLEAEAAFGLALFPSTESVAQCAAGTINVEPRQRNAALIASTLDDTEPEGGTPTGATIQIVRDYFSARQSDVVTLVILATDGVPNCNEGADGNACTCTFPPGSGYTCVGAPEGCLDDTATISAIRGLAIDGIRTYVIGLPGSADPTDVLSRMAEAGGTRASPAQAYYRPTSTQELTDDMTAIVLSNRACRFELEEAPNDPGRVEVRLDGVVIQRDQGRRAGWDLVGQKGVELYGEPCNTLRRGVQHTVSVLYCVDY